MIFGMVIYNNNVIFVILLCFFPSDDNDNGCHSDGEDDAGLDDSSSVYGIMVSTGI